MNKIDKLIRSAIKESMHEKSEELHSMIQDEDWNPNAPVTISAQSTDIAEEDEEMGFDIQSDDDETCKYHMDNFGPDDERTQMFCKGEMTEKLHRGQKKLDKNKNGKIDAEDFKLLRKSKSKKEVKEVEVSDLKKGGKYKFKSPSFEDELEYLDKMDYPESGSMHSFRGKKASHSMSKKDVEDFVSDFDKEVSKLQDYEIGEGVGYYDNIDSEHFHEKTGGMYQSKHDDEEIDDVEELDVTMKKRRPTGDEYIDFEEMKPTEKKSFFSRMKNKLGLGEEETIEGNAFTGALAKARKTGDEEFEVGGKKYETKEGDEKFIQKAVKKMEKKGTEGSFKEYCGGEVTKSCIDKAMKSGDPKLVKKANFAKNIKAYKGAEHKKKSVKESFELTESEMIDLIEQIVLEQKNNQKFATKTPKGMIETEKALKGSKKENEDYIKSVTKKLKDYLKDGSKGNYDMNPNQFPKGNGELAKMNKKAYVPSEAVEEYISDFAYPGQTNLRYDEIKPNDERIKKQLEGDPTNGNSQDYANAVKSDVGKKFKKNYDDNVYGAEQSSASYKRYPQPVDVEGETVQRGSLKSKKTGLNKANKILNQLESTEKKTDVLISEEFNKMKTLINYNKKTQ